MPTTNYNTYNRRIRSETTAGAITTYLTDALGSVTATVNQSQVIENTYRYKPYGATLDQTGSGPVPGFLWTGDSGSRPTELAQSGQYNRARHLSTPNARWSSVDPLWPWQPSYCYVAGRPVTLIDLTGMAGCQAQLPQTFNGYDCATYPQGVCAFAAKVGGVDAGANGGVACCNGQKYACVWNIGGMTGGQIGCAILHEKSHFPQVGCGPGFDMPGMRADRVDRNECAAYQAQFACLVNMRLAECGVLFGGILMPCLQSYHQKLCFFCCAVRPRPDCKGVEYHYHCPPSQVPNFCGNCP